MHPLNYNSIFEHRISHKPNLRSEEQGIVFIGEVALKRFTQLRKIHEAGIL
jgi:hypothetical protein